VVGSDFIRFSHILKNEDASLQEPIVLGLRDYIQRSDETARRALVDAGILPVILPASAFVSSYNEYDLLYYIL
jgi:hypothetical protein